MVGKLLFLYRFCIINSNCCRVNNRSFKFRKEVLIEVKPINSCCGTLNEDKTLISARFKESWEYTKDIFLKIYLYVIVGIAIGAFIHGYIPTEFISKYAGGDVWYAPIVAVVMGILCIQMQLGFYHFCRVLTQKGC